MRAIISTIIDDLMQNSLLDSLNGSLSKDSLFEVLSGLVTLRAVCEESND